MQAYKDMTSVLEERVLGEFALKKFTITSKNRGFRNPLPYGDYIRLVGHGETMMSDTPMEKSTNHWFVENVHGDVFIAGLGIGLILLAIQDKEEVRSITVLEKSKEIIEIVGEQLPLNDKVKIVEGDVFAYTFERGTKFDCLYFDIWNYVNSDVYEEMKKLKNRYRKHKKTLAESPNAFIKCWAEYQAKHNRPLF